WAPRKSPGLSESVSGSVTARGAASLPDLGRAITGARLGCNRERHIPAPAHARSPSDGAMVSQELAPAYPAQRPTRTAESTTRPPVERRASQLPARRASIQRAIELTRWRALLFAAVANNFTRASPSSA